jgi:hypothetical protein
MRQLVSSLFQPKTGLAVLSLLFLGLAVAGCGKGSANVVPTSISITPSSSISLKYGQVQTLTAQVLDNNGSVMTNQKFVWTSSNTNLATLTADGSQCSAGAATTDTSCICGGTWSSDFIICKQPVGPNGQPQSGTATITVSSDGLSTSITALVHAGVARVSVSPSSVDCLSAAGSQQLTAKAYDANGNDITNEVAVAGSSFNWLSTDPTVVSIDTNGLATAVNPGRTNMYASIAGTSSAPASFTTCPVVSLSLAVSGGSDNSFSLAQASTQQLTATAIDSNNKTITITSGRLNYDSSVPNAVTVTTSGLATATNPGTAAIVASCAPPFCNNGLFPVYSNVVTGTTQGTTASGTNHASTQVLVGSPSTTSLIPVDITTAKAGTAITLPYAPNSLVFTRNGSTAYMGSSAELMTYDPTTNIIGVLAQVPGVIVDLSYGGNRMVIYDDVGKTVTVLNPVGGSIVDKFSVPTATPSTVHASTSPDEQTTYIVVGSTLYISSSTAALQTVNLTAPANDVAFLLQGSFAYLAGGETNSITARATCNAAERDVLAVANTPDRVIPSADGSKVYALSGSTLSTVTATTSGAGCPPPLTDSIATTDLGQGAISPTQIFPNFTNSKLYMITSAGNIVVYDTAANTATSISLSSGKATTGALTMDGSSLYVGGGSDNNLHRIDTSTNTDAQTIPVGIPADLVAVRYL